MSGPAAGGPEGSSAPQGAGAACPGCGGPVRAVGLKTVKHLLRYPLSRTVRGEGWLHCTDPGCDVYYFRTTGSAGPAARGAAPGGPRGLEVFRAANIKDRALPFARGGDRLVCHCFGYTAGDIATDAREGRHEIPAAIAGEVRAGMCGCEILNPGGG